MQKICAPVSKWRFSVLIVLTGTLLFASGCGSGKRNAEAVIKDRVKGLQPKDTKLDLYVTDSNHPDLAYASATVTYNFATASGEPQREYLGFVLKRDGKNWKIEHPATYTTDENKAKAYMVSPK
jgi:hypothetical protein